MNAALEMERFLQSRLRIRLRVVVSFRVGGVGQPIVPNHGVVAFVVAQQRARLTPTVKRWLDRWFRSSRKLGP